MRYTSALVLSTLAIGQAAAINNKHASFHARRVQNEEKRSVTDVNWEEWAKAQGSGFWSTAADWDAQFGKKAKPTSVPAAAPSVVEAAGYKSAATTPAPAAYTSAPAAVSSASSPKSSGSANVGNIANKVGGFLNGVNNIFDKFNIKIDKTCNSESNTSPMYIGTDGQWKATFTNSKSEDVVLVCWHKEGMWINASPPPIAIGLKKGESTTISFKDGVSGGCGPMTSSTDLHNGQVTNTILEFTFQKNAGGFDVSREVNMKGDYISAKGQNSGCLSDNENCVFKCKSGDSCYELGTYHLTNMGPGCHGTESDGSCELGHVASEHLDVVFK